ncbi:MAG: hypothetical protein NTW08_00645 [Gammaproteobacteria bacterium]|nr:hypothetical protein [Gammaproteobacteria bacterium]
MPKIYASMQVLIDSDIPISEKLLSIHKLIKESSFTPHERFLCITQLMHLADQISEHSELQIWLNDCLDHIMLQTDIQPDTDTTLPCPFLWLQEKPLPLKLRPLRFFLINNNIQMAYARTAHELYFLYLDENFELFIESLLITDPNDSLEALYADLDLPVFVDTSSPTATLQSTISRLDRITRATGHVAVDRQYARRGRSARYDKVVLDAPYATLPENPLSTLQTLTYLHKKSLLKEAVIKAFYTFFNSKNREERLERWFDIQYSICILEHCNILSFVSLKRVIDVAFHKNFSDLIYYEAQRIDAAQNVLAPTEREALFFEKCQPYKNVSNPICLPPTPMDENTD